MTRGEAVAEFAAALELGLTDSAVRIAGCHLDAMPFFLSEIENHPMLREYDLARALLDEVERAKECGYEGALI